MKKIYSVFFFLFFFSFIGAPVIHSQDLILPKEATPYVDENDFQTEDPMKVKDLFSVNNILKLLTTALEKVFLSVGKIIGSLVVIIIISSLFRQMKFGACGNITEKTSAVILNCIIILILLPEVKSACKMLSSTVESVDIFTKSSLPVLSTLFLSNGQPFTSVVFSSGIALLCNIMTWVSNEILLPLIMVYISLGVCQVFSDHYSICRVTSFFKKIILWFLGVVFSIFSFSFTMQSFLARSADSISKKVVKTAVSTIPMIGNAISGGLEGVYSLASSVKNTFLSVGIFVIIAVFIGPILYTALLSFTTSACEMICGFFEAEMVMQLLKTIKEAFDIHLVLMVSSVVICIISYLLICINV